MTTDCQYISPKEAARILGVNRKTVLAALKKGTMRAKRIGRRWCIPKSETVARAEAAASSRG